MKTDENIVDLNDLSQDINNPSNSNVMLGTIDPNGDSATSFFQVNGNLVLDPVSGVNLNINGLIAGSEFDQVKVEGTVDLANATLDVIMGFIPEEEDTFVVVDNDGVDPITGIFHHPTLGPINEGDIVTYGDTPTNQWAEFKVSYLGGDDNNDVVLTYIGIASGVWFFDDNLLLGGTDMADNFYIKHIGSDALTTVVYRLGNIMQNQIFFDSTNLAGIHASLKEGNDRFKMFSSMTVPANIDGGTDTNIEGEPGNNNNDYIQTGSGDDFIDGGDGNNRIYAGKGNNTVVTLGGADYIVTKEGDDTVDAGDGENYVNVGDGEDNVTTGEDDDVIRAGEGPNTIDAGDGDNQVTALGVKNFADVIEIGLTEVPEGGFANDITTGSGSDRIITSSGNDIIDAGDGDNVINAGHGDNEITTGDDDDVIDVYSGDNKIYAGGGNNEISTQHGDNIIEVLDGDNDISTGNGNDNVEVGSGSNVVRVQGGDDHVEVVNSGNWRKSILWRFRGRRPLRWRRIR